MKWKISVVHPRKTPVPGSSARLINLASDLSLQDKNDASAQSRSMLQQPATLPGLATLADWEADARKASVDFTSLRKKDSQACLEIITYAQLHSVERQE